MEVGVAGGEGEVEEGEGWGVGGGGGEGVLLGKEFEFFPGDEF